MHLNRFFALFVAAGLAAGCASFRQNADSPQAQHSVAQAQPAWSPALRIRVQHHVVCLLAISAGDPRFMEALDEGVNTLRGGAKTVVLFDAQSVPWLRVHPRRENKTLLHDAEITGEPREALAKRLGVPVANAPRNYFEYVQYLANAGAKVVVNRTAMLQFGLKDEEIHPIAARFSLAQVEILFDESDYCSVVGEVTKVRQ
jgi:hypothetical protein